MVEKVLVIGGAGYLGTEISQKLLREGAKVTCLDNLMHKQGQNIIPLAMHPNFEFVYGDTRDARVVSELVRDKDAVFPLAAIVGAPACKAREFDARSINLDSIKTLVDLLSPNQKVVFPNSNSGYGTTPAGQITTEETPMNPLSVYGSTKAEAEKIIANRENSVAYRLATVFGPSLRQRTDLIVNDFVRRALTGQDMIMYQPHARRNFVYVRDVAEAFYFALTNFDKLKQGKVFNLGCDALNSTKIELAKAVKEVFPKFRWQIGEGEDPDKRDYNVSNDKLRRYGFECQQRTFREPILELEKVYSAILPGLDPTTNK